MMMPSTLSIIANVFLPEERGKAMGFWGGVSGFSLALGPSLGGLLVEAESWRWIFFINVPIGVVLLRRRPALHSRVDRPHLGQADGLSRGGRAHRRRCSA